MSYRLKVSSLALLDIEDAIFWYEYRSERLGKALQECLYEGFEYISKYPLHSAKKYKEVRVKFIRRFPYGIHFIVEEDEVKVIAFFHMKRDPKRWTRRLKGEE